MKQETDFFEKVRNFLAENPIYFGIFVVLIGVFALLAAIFNWKWVFSGHSFNTKKLEGISNMWGRGCARIVAGAGGVCCIFTGIIYMFLLLF